MPKTKNFSLLRDKVMARPGAEQRVAALREELLAEVGLYELRRSQEVSQTQLAELLHISQGAVSKFENSDDVRLSTLRQYIEALGGRLEVSARFDDRTVKLDIKPREEVA
ncbi:MAG: XRE family transcriptional regulator [Dehalococcoidia bacterium]|jgi:predicted transcriptional regulator|nr:XRE family transcriptional regulator [Dehalococcoidia bacterium]